MLVHTFVFRAYSTPSSLGEHDVTLIDD